MGTGTTNKDATSVRYQADRARLWLHIWVRLWLHLRRRAYVCKKSKHPFDIDAMLRIVAAIRHG
jgi:hypothetical protein